jgi:hypothetical protein
MRYESLGLYERILIKSLLIERIQKLENGSEAAQLALNAWNQFREAEDVVIVRKDK